MIHRLPGFENDKTPGGGNIQRSGILKPEKRFRNGYPERSRRQNVLGLTGNRNKTIQSGILRKNPT